MGSIDAGSEVASRQAPLRERYQREPSEAITVKQVRAVPAPTTDLWHSTVVTGTDPAVTWVVGIDAKVGGHDDLPNPGHVLCAALATCMDSTLRMIADHLGVGIQRLEVDVTGEVDVRGCLSMDPDVRPGFRQLQCRVRFEPDPTADQRLVRLALAQAQQLCVTLETLRNGVPVEVTTHPSPATGPALRSPES